MIFITTGVKIQTLKFDLGTLGWDPKQSQEAHGDMKFQKYTMGLFKYINENQS